MAVGTILKNEPIKLLWTNSTPSSSFVSQTISIDLTNYQFVIITAYFSSTYRKLLSAVIVPTNDILFRISDVDSVGSVLYREGKVSTTGVLFNAGYLSGDNNTVCIPYQIYGCKH